VRARCQVEQERGVVLNLLGCVVIIAFDGGTLPQYTGIVLLPPVITDARRPRQGGRVVACGRAGWEPRLTRADGATWRPCDTVSPTRTQSL
jgi:hypothetical protein